jgi:hypothetical protein
MIISPPYPRQHCTAYLDTGRGGTAVSAPSLASPDDTRSPIVHGGPLCGRVKATDGVDRAASPSPRTRDEVMPGMAQIGDAQHDRFQRVSHGATCNANPYGAATGNAALTIVTTGERHS